MNDFEELHKKTEEFEILVDTLGKISDNYTEIYKRSLNDFKKRDNKKNKFIIGVLICLFFSIMANLFITIYTINIIKSYQEVEYLDYYEYDIEQDADNGSSNFNNIGGEQDIN